MAGRTPPQSPTGPQGSEQPRTGRSTTPRPARGSHAAPTSKLGKATDAAQSALDKAAGVGKFAGRDGVVGKVGRTVETAQLGGRALGGDVTAMGALAGRAAKNKHVRRAVGASMLVSLSMVIATVVVLSVMFTSIISAVSGTQNQQQADGGEAAQRSGLTSASVNQAQSVTDNTNVSWALMGAIEKTSSTYPGGTGPYGIDLCHADLDGDGKVGDPSNLAACSADSGDLGSVTATGPVNPGQFRVSTFNVLGASHTDKPNPDNADMASGVERTRLAYQILNTRNVSVAGFQEMQPEQRAEFKKISAGTWEFYDPNHTQNPIAWRTDTWRADARKTFKIYYYHGRKVTVPFVLLSHLPSGNKVWIYNVHHPADVYGESQRYRDKDRALGSQLVNRLHATGYPVVWTGDMNEYENFACTVQRVTNMQNAYKQGLGDCPLPKAHTIDWIMGTRELGWKTFDRDRGGLVSDTTDHPFYSAVATFDGMGANDGIPAGANASTPKGIGSADTKYKAVGDKDDVSLAENRTTASRWLVKQLDKQISVTRTGKKNLQLDAGSTIQEYQDGSAARQVDGRDTSKVLDSTQVRADWTGVIDDAGLAGGPERASHVFGLARTWVLGREVREDCAGSAAAGLADYSTGRWSSPAEGSLTSPFGPRIHPITHQASFHTGADIGVPMGTPVHAAASGTVRVAEFMGAFGWTIILAHGGGVETQYSHMPSASAFKVHPGDTVTVGQVIGAVGSSGYSTGPHMHMEVHIDSNPVDPVAFLASKGVRYGAKPVSGSSVSADGSTLPVVDSTGSNGTKPSGVPATLTATDAFGRRINLDHKQLVNAGIIIGVGQKTAGVGSRGIQIALMTALQESSLRRYANSSVPESLGYPHEAVGSDNNSLGLMQQRPPSWGSVKDLMDPTYNAKAFFGGPTGPNHGSPQGLLDTKGWESMSLGQAAQDVQVSAYPDAYDKWKPVAALLMEKVGGITAPGDPLLSSNPCVAAAQTASLEGMPPAPPGSPVAIEKAIAFAAAQRGEPYVWGATGPDSWDCSGLMLRAWGAAGVSLPRTSAAQSKVGTPVNVSDMQRGDLVFYGSPVHHVAMYLGEGKVIHAPHTGDVVRIADVHMMPITGVRRVG